MEFDNRIVERRYRARPHRSSATMNHHHHLRKSDHNTTMLASSNMGSYDPYIERAYESAFDHTEQHGQGVAGGVEEIVKHSTNLLSSPRMEKYIFNYQESHSVKINPQEFDSKRVPEEGLEFINEDPSRNEHLYHHTNPLMTSTSPSKLQKQYQTQGDHHEISCQPNLSSNLASSSLCQMVSSKQHRRYTFTSDLPLKILTIFVMNAILNQLSQHLISLHTTDDKLQYQLHLTRLFPTVVSALTTTSDIDTECRRDSDCDEMRCYQGKCICPKDRPLEDRGVCLPLSVVGEICTVSEQCLGNSVCLDSYCSCGSDTISLFNPSSKIYYCHPKRRLREECSHDAQCPVNSFCSTNKCLCQNGYGPVTVKNTDGAEIAECLPKKCSFSKDCESEYHFCEDNRCICLADHFDPHTAECYKFGSTGGKLSVNQTIDDSATGSNNDSSRPDSAKGFGSILKDLMKNSDKLWYVIIILAVLTIILLALIVMSLRKYFLGYCWTAHKKEYEPNNKSAPKSAYFNKDSINNKSFRQKNGETDDDGDDDNDDTAADRSNLVTTVNKSRGGGALLNNDNRRPASAANSNKELGTGNRYVKVDMRAANAIDDEDRQQSYEQADSTNVHYQPHHQQLLSQPLSTSSSTAV